MSVLGALVPNGRPLVVVSVFLGAISYAPRTWEDLRTSKSCDFLVRRSTWDLGHVFTRFPLGLLACNILLTLLQSVLITCFKTCETTEWYDV